MPLKNITARKEYDRNRPNYEERKRIQRERTAAWKKAHPIETRISRQKYMLMWRYGLTPEQYKEMYDSQGGVCANPACNRPIGAVDHNHSTEETRGLLCGQCNKGLGLFKDSIAMLEGAIQYLKGYEHVG